MNGQRIYGPIGNVRSTIDDLCVTTVIAISTPENRGVLKSLADHMNGSTAEVITIPSYLDYVLGDTSISVLEGFSIDNVFSHNRKIMYTPTIVSQKLQP